MNLLINQALRYAKAGLSIIPLKPKGKEPLIPWQEYQHRRASESEIRVWWTKWPDANVAIVTGSISGVICVDLDGEEGFLSANQMKLTSMVISLTGNGKHLWYKHPGGVVENAVRKYPGIDVRGDGGYVLAPPSIHPNGKRYRFQNVLNVTALSSLSLFPKTVFAQVVSQTELLSKHEEGWIAKALEDMKDGNIDNTLTSILGRMRYDGWSASDAQAMVLPHALSKGATNGHLEAKIENIWNRYKSKTSMEQRPLDRFGNGTGLIIHSPTNPDSIKQYEQCRFQMDSENGQQNALLSGYSKLDQMLQGGLKSSRLFTVAARTGTGKTNFIIGVARSLCESGRRVLIFSTETPYTELWQRYITTLQDPNSFSRHALYVCDSFAPNIEKVEEAINEIKPDLFIFDHINHVSEEQRELGAFMQGLNFLRRKYQCAGIVTAQLNRSADWIDLKTGEKVTPRMSMIKGSGTIEQASSRVLLLSETRVLPEYTEILGNLDKNDNGPKGIVHFGLMNSPYKMVEL